MDKQILSLHSVDQWQEPAHIKTFVRICVSGHKDKPEWLQCCPRGSWCALTFLDTFHRQCHCALCGHVYSLLVPLGQELGWGEVEWRWVLGRGGWGGWQMKEGTTRRSPKLWCGFSWGINDWTGFSFILLLLEGMRLSVICVCTSASERGRKCTNSSCNLHRWASVSTQRTLRQPAEISETLPPKNTSKQICHRLFVQKGMCIH